MPPKAAQSGEAGGGIMGVGRALILVSEVSEQLCREERGSVRTMGRGNEASDFLKD